MKSVSIIITLAMLLVPRSSAQERVISSPGISDHSAAPQATQFRLGKLSFTGNKHTKVTLLLWLIPLNAGDIFDQTRWELGLDQINRLGLFEPVSPSDATFTFDYAQGLVDVELKLVERDRQRIDLSGGGGTTGGLSVGLDYANINLNGIGDRLVAEVREGNRERSFGGSYSRMILSKRPITFDASGYYRRLEFVDASMAGNERTPLFVSKTSGAGFGFSIPLQRSPYRIGSATRLNVRYSFGATNLVDTFVSATSGTEQALEQNGIRVASITPAFVYDTLDRGFDPTAGQQFTMDVDLGARWLGGSLNVVEPLVEYRRFFRLGRAYTGSAREREPRVVGLRVQASHISAFGKRFQPEALSSVGGVPIFKRFFLGGPNEIRGYDVNSIAPLERVDRSISQSGGEPVLLSSQVRPIGGDAKIVMNAEYRIPLFWRFSAAAFADFGASFNLRRLREERIQSTARIESVATPAQIETVLLPIDSGLPSYRVSIGGELRFHIPVLNLPVRFILAANPNAQKRLPEGALLAPEKRFFYGFGFGRVF